MARSVWINCRSWSVLLGTLAVAVVTADAVSGADEKGNSMSYGEAREFLAKHTKVIELTNASGARVAVVPEWQGRVMTSTCGGLDGISFGFVNRDYIEAGQINPHINNYGAEDRMWLCPEGGPFSLWFKPGAEQLMENWFTPPALNVGAWKAEATSPDAVTMSTHMNIENTAAATFAIDVRRTVKLLGTEDFAKLFGKSAAATVGQDGVKMVAYETANQITNRGPVFVKDKGLLSIWILGMMNAGPKTVIIVPYKAGPESDLGPVVKADYFGQVPPDRLKVTPEAVLFCGDGKFRSKIGTSQRRARNVAGSIDFEAGVLTLVQFNMPEDPAKLDYLNNMWGVPQPKPYTGDVVNSYNDGPNDLGTQLGAFYEIESISPSPVLKTDQSLVHMHRTIHVQADPATLRKLAQQTLGVDLDAVKKAFP